MKNTIKMLLLKILGPVLLSKSEITKIEQFGEHFRILTIKGKALKKAQWKAGQKVTVKINDNDMRSYTPINWDNQTGSFQTLIVLHNNGPLSRWAKQIKPKSKVTILGPKGSLSLDETKKEVIFFGDDTTLGLISAIENNSPNTTFHNFIESNYLSNVEEVITRLNISSTEVYPMNAFETYQSDIFKKFNELTENSLIILSGKQQNIVKVRDYLRLQNVPKEKVQVKVYWGWKDDPNGKLSAQN